MANYDVTITNGTGSQNMIIGEYNVSATYAPGYDMSTLSPTTFNATSTTQTGAFTLSANGELTIVFNETGAVGGTPITSGTVVMTNQDGTEQYGNVVQIDTNGTAVFNNVPYGTAQSGYTLYFKQLTSDAEHNIYSDVFVVGMGDQTQTEYILNTLNTAVQNFTLTDVNYTNMPIYNASLNFQSN